MRNLLTNLKGLILVAPTVRGGLADATYTLSIYDNPAADSGFSYAYLGPMGVHG
jgi:hypothetical protein